jgi:hypothetical protein
MKQYTSFDYRCNNKPYFLVFCVQIMGIMVGSNRAVSTAVHAR